MIGRREIVRLRTAARDALGVRFDMRNSEGAVLSQGAVPLAVLERVVQSWVASVQAS